MDFMTIVWIGIARMKKAKPARALGPSWRIRRVRQIAIWIGAAHAFKTSLELVVKIRKGRTMWK